MMFTEDGQNEDESWTQLVVKTSINEEGWFAEMKIPFSQVRFDKNSGDVWVSTLPGLFTGEMKPISGSIFQGMLRDWSICLVK